MAPVLPVVRVVGSGRNVGKTWLAEHLIEWFTAHGCEVLAVKRSHHPVTPDRPGTDSDRFARAGAATVVFGGSDGTLVRAPRAESLEEIITRFSTGADLAIVEGFSGDVLGAQLRILAGSPATVHLTASDGLSLLTAPLDDVDAIAEAVARALDVEVDAGSRQPSGIGAL